MFATQAIQVAGAVATIGIATCGSVAAAWAAPSQLHQDIFTADCTETTIHTGAGVTTAYGCPESPTIETTERIISRSPMIFSGWFDALNQQSFEVNFSNGQKYILGVDVQLSAVGDRWELRLLDADILSPGTYTMTVLMRATNGSTVVASKTFIVSAHVDLVDPPTRGAVVPGENGSSTSAGSLRRSVVSGASSEFIGGMSHTTPSGAGQHGDEGRIVSDVTTPLIEQFRRVVMSYVNPSWLLTFIASALFFGYVFYLLGRHYRHIEEEHRNQLRALKRAARRKNAKPKQALHHAVGAHKKRHV